MDDRNQITRSKFVSAWNETMVKIWTERIRDLEIKDTGSLLESVISLPVRADGRFYEVELSQMFLEYGIWQDLGVGRNTARGNTHRRDKDDWENKREIRRWFSTKYFSSFMNLTDFMAESLGDEFRSIFANLDAADLRNSTEYYRKKGIV